MSSRVEIVVSGEAIALARPRFRQVHTRDGRNFVHTFNPSHVNKWQSHARLCAQQAMNGRAPLDGPLRGQFIFVMPIPASWSKRKTAEAMCGSIRPLSRPDCSNLLKNFEDACNGIVYRDDSQIVALHVSKVYGGKPEARAIIEPIGLTTSEEQRGLFQ